MTYEKAFTERCILDSMEFSQNCILVIKNTVTVDARGYVIDCIDADFARNRIHMPYCIYVRGLLRCRLMTKGNARSLIE